MVEILANIACSFVATIGYAILFNVPRKYYLACGVVGTVGWMGYIMGTQYAGLSEGISAFIGALLLVLLSRMLTVRMRCPITLFLVPGICPMVPGAGICFTTYYLVTNQLALALEKGIGCIKVSFGLVFGIVFILAMPREFFQIRYWKQLWIFRKRTRKS